MPSVWVLIQLLIQVCFVANKEEGKIINILFQKLHYPLEQDYDFKKIC